MTTLLVILVLLAFVCGAELFSVMLLAAAVGAITLAVDGRLFDEQFYGMVVSMFGVGTGEHATVLSTIPMFIYAGYILAESKTADRLVRFANAMVGWFPGGLAIVTISTCALFTTFTGASGVTIVALGGVLLPALVKNGYPKKFSMGMLAGTGSVGLLFPPALPLFIYGTIYGLQLVGDSEAAANWDTQRFLFAGIVPGIVLIGAISLVAVFVARKLPRQPFDLGELGKSFVAALPELIIPFGVILGLAKGFALPEVASLTVAYVIVLELGILRMIKPSMLWTVSREAMVMVGAIFVIILCSTVFTNYIVTAEIPTKLVNWTTQYVDSKIVFLLVLNVLLLVVGMLMDIFSAIVIVLPLIVPISRHYGIDPYHLGVIFLLNLEVGYLTPPVGLNLFITSIKFQQPVIEVMRATMPFLATMVVVLVIVTYVPALTIYPEAKRRDPVNNLVLMVKAGKEEARVAVKEITLVDHAGTVLKDSEGKPVVRRFGECNLVTDHQGKPTRDDKGRMKLPDETQKTACQKPFFDITECLPPGQDKPTDPKQVECTNRAIAKYVAERYNEDYPAHALIVIEEVPLANAEGEPLTYEEEIKGPDGKPQLNDLGAPETETKQIADKDGKPFVRTLAWCKTLEFTSDQERCRQLFIMASACKINPELDEDCIEEKCEAASDEAPDSEKSGEADGENQADAEAPAADPDACKKAAAEECGNAKLVACVADAAKAWADENPSISRNPKIAGTGAAPAGGAQPTGKSGGCSAGGGTAGLAFVGAALLALRRRRGHAARC
jgi:C4-dicarboxylate transporter, DctM subunit